MPSSNERLRERYHTEPGYREKVKARSRERQRARYRTDPEYRARELARLHRTYAQRMQSDPGYRHKVVSESRNRRLNESLAQRARRAKTTRAYSRRKCVRMRRNETARRLRAYEAEAGIESSYGRYSKAYRARYPDRIKAYSALRMKRDRDLYKKDPAAYRAMRGYRSAWAREYRKSPEVKAMHHSYYLENKSRFKTNADRYRARRLADKDVSLALQALTVGGSNVI